MIQEVQEEKDIDSFLNKIKEAVYNYPLALKNIKDYNLIEYINFFLPYSVGLEFECPKKEVYDLNNFLKIENILDVNVDNYEQRYRIPKGLRGLICLYEICEQLKINTKLDLGSSIHCHTDLTDIWENSDNLISKEVDDKIIEELISWKTAKDLSQKRGWYKLNHLKTLEIRILEPTFDYNILVNRVIQCCNINSMIRSQFNPKTALYLLEEKLKNLQVKEVSLIENLSEYKKIISKRIIKV